MLGCLCAKIFSETQLVDKNHKAITACFDYYIVKSLAKFRWQLGRAGVRLGHVRTLSGCARNWWEIVRARTRDWKLEGRGRRAWTCGVVAVSRGRAPQHWLFPPFPDQKPLCWRRNWIRRQVNCSLSLMGDRPLLVTTSPRAVVTIIPSLIQRLSTATSHQPPATSHWIWIKWRSAGQWQQSADLNGLTFTMCIEYNTENCRCE